MYNNGTSTVSTGAFTGIFLTSAIFSLIVIIFAVIIFGGFSPKQVIAAR